MRSSRVYRHFPTVDAAAFLDAVLFVREELNNINYERRETERERERGGTRRRYTWLAHWPLRCPPVSNAIINYLVGATALAPPRSLSHSPTLLPRDLFLPLSSLARLSLSHSLSLSLSLFFSLLLYLLPRDSLARRVCHKTFWLFVVTVFRSQLTRQEPNLC